MSQQVRFSPSSLDAVFWLSGWVVVNRADGSELAVAPGHHPAWLDGSPAIVFCPPEDGNVQGAIIRDGRVILSAWPGLPAGNTLTAASGKVAVHRTDPRRTICSWDGFSIMGETDPALSADGVWLVTLAPDDPHGGVSTVRLRPNGQGWRNLYVGAPQRPRFSHTGTSLCWEDAGQIYGIADVANPQSPVVRLSRPEDSLSHPVPLWVPGVGLFVLYVQASGGDAGTLMLAEWGSCVAQAPVGYVVAQSGGSGYSHDVQGAA